MALSIKIVDGFRIILNFAGQYTIYLNLLKQDNENWSNGHL